MGRIRKIPDGKKMGSRMIAGMVATTVYQGQPTDFGVVCNLFRVGRKWEVGSAEMVFKMGEDREMMQHLGRQ